MESPPWRPIAKYLRRFWLRASHDARAVPFVTGLCATLTIFFLIYITAFPTITPTTTRTPLTTQTLFIAIGSAPQNRHLRDTARDTWLTWLPTDGSVAYRFFTDSPPSLRSATNASMWRSLRNEVSAHDDVVLQPLPSGYGTNSENEYGQRALYQLHWAVHNLQSRYFLRIDDDSFLCLHRLLYELRTAPVEQFFWGRFWCREGRNRADENFMLFSADVVDLLTDDRLVGRLLPFDEHVTLGWNFGYWSWILNLTVFDDQTRIDAQQGYLTKYMHGDGQMEPFCQRFLYAHHVAPDVMKAAFRNTTTHVMYSMPVRRSPKETCGEGEQSFVPGRHSSKLPAVKITRTSSTDE